MKQGLSLRVSQHLALTPQLQQSIRLLQLSTLELGQEVEQMLDDNPFLERVAEEAERESFGLEQSAALEDRTDQESDAVPYSGSDYASSAGSKADSDVEDSGALHDEGPNWDGD